LSHDPNTNETGPVWNKETVEKLAARHYFFRDYLLNGYLLPPWRLKNFFLINTTGYSRSSVMADVFNRKIFASGIFDRPTFGELNPDRPYLVLNAANASEDYWAKGNTSEDYWAAKMRDGGANIRKFGTVFTFTKEDFDSIGSDIDEYPVAYGVMASAAFPGAFNYITLKDHNASTYVHLFDGGVIDNLGLLSVKEMISEFKVHYKGSFPVVVVVILVDSQLYNSGADSGTPDVRDWYDHIVDFDSVFDFSNYLMAASGGSLNDFIQGEWKGLDPNFRIILWHLTFNRIGFWPTVGDPRGARRQLYRTVQTIPTRMSVSSDNKVRIDKAVDLMFSKSKCLEEITNILNTCNSVSSSSGGVSKCAEAPAPTRHDDCYRENIARPVTVEQVKNASPPAMGGAFSGSDIHFRQLDFPPVYMDARRSARSEVQLRIKNNMPDFKNSAGPRLQCPGISEEDEKSERYLFPRCTLSQTLKRQTPKNVFVPPKIADRPVGPVPDRMRLDLRHPGSRQIYTRFTRRVCVSLCVPAKRRGKGYG
jgi:hypothetical protein